MQLALCDGLFIDKQLVPINIKSLFSRSKPLNIEEYEGYSLIET